MTNTELAPGFTENNNFITLETVTRFYAYNRKFDHVSELRFGYTYILESRSRETWSDVKYTIN